MILDMLRVRDFDVQYACARALLHLIRHNGEVGSGVCSACRIFVFAISFVPFDLLPTEAHKIARRSVLLIFETIQSEQLQRVASYCSTGVVSCFVLVVSITLLDSARSVYKIL